jgi:hypothetical protein
VSLLYAMTEDQDVLDACRDSVHETMRDLEAEMKTRVRKKGRNEERTTGNLVYGEFVPFTSRPVNRVPDPQLHAHCFVFNSTYDAEEAEWVSVHIGRFHRRILSPRPPHGEALGQRWPILGLWVLFLWSLSLGSWCAVPWLR